MLLLTVHLAQAHMLLLGLLLLHHDWLLLVRLMWLQLLLLLVLLLEKLLFQGMLLAHLQLFLFFKLLGNFMLIVRLIQLGRWPRGGGLALLVLRCSSGRCRVDWQAGVSAVFLDWLILDSLILVDLAARVLVDLATALPSLPILSLLLIPALLHLFLILLLAVVILLLHLLFLILLLRHGLVVLILLLLQQLVLILLVR